MCFQGAHAPRVLTIAPFAIANFLAFAALALGGTHFGEGAEIARERVRSRTRSAILLNFAPASR